MSRERVRLADGGWDGFSGRLAKIAAASAVLGPALISLDGTARREPLLWEGDDS